MLRQGHWNDITHHNVDAKCAEFTKSNEKFEAQVSKWSLPKSVKSALFSWRGKFYAAMEKEFPESSSTLRERAKTDTNLNEEIKHNDALWTFVNHKRKAYQDSAERLNKETPRSRGSRETSTTGDNEGGVSSKNRTSPAEGTQEPTGNNNNGNPTVGTNGSKQPDHVSGSHDSDNGFVHVPHSSKKSSANGTPNDDDGFELVDSTPTHD
jgi:hypothetical protein